jgi:hypothetical protein
MNDGSITFTSEIQKTAILVMLIRGAVLYWNVVHPEFHEKWESSVSLICEFKIDQID